MSRNPTSDEPSTEIHSEALDEREAHKDPAAQALGSRGGKKRAERLSAERRSEIARMAAAARWSSGK